MRKLLADCGVAINDDGRGDGAAARVAWATFKAIAAEPVGEPSVHEDGAEVTVAEGTDADLLLFEFGVMRRDNNPEDKWVADRRTLPATGFELMFRRQFSFDDAAGGEYFGMNALFFSIEFDPFDDLVTLEGPQVWGRGGPPERSDQSPWTNPADEWGEDVPTWLAKVERHPVFRAAFEHRPRGFHVGQSDY